MLHSEFAKKVVSGALAPILVVGLVPAIAFADEASGEAQTVTEQAAELAAADADELSQIEAEEQITEGEQDATAATAATAAATAEESDSTALTAQGDVAESSVITFSDDAISIEGSTDGTKVEGTALTINAAGTYVITGSCSEGSITVKKGTTGVTLVLSDLTLTSSTTAPLACNKATEVTLDIQGNVVLTDAEDPANEESTDEVVADAFEGAAIKAKSGSTLVITGTGTLTADGTACKNGIKGAASASITIEGDVTVNASAANSGIASDGTLLIADGVINVEAGNDGIKVSPDADDAESAGVLTISGGTVNVTAADDGIKADPETGNTVAAGTANITGGTITVSAGDDGIKAAYDLNIGTAGSSSGPAITVVQSTEGLEGATINLYSGTGSITASDDGVNAANKDLSSTENTELFNLNISGGTWTVDSQGDGLDSNGNITVTGGNTVVFGPASGGNGVFDVADQGGSFTVSGGTLLGIGTSDMALTPTSGTYVVFGGGAMGGGMTGNMGGGQAGMQNGGRGGMGGMRTMSDEADPSAAEQATAENADMSAQAMPGGQGMHGGSSYTVKAGQTVSVQDASGNVVASTTAIRDAQWVLYASGDLQEGQTYTLSSGSGQVATATVQSGMSAGGGMQPGQPGGTPAGDGSTQPTPPAGGTQPGGGSQPGDGQQSPALPDGSQPGAPADGQQPPALPDGQQPGAPADDRQQSGAMHRLYNPNSGEHFYTADDAEYQGLISLGWQDEGIGWVAPESGSAVYRLYNPNAGEHHYTTSLEECEALVTAGWNYEGIGWYSDSSEATPLYRLYNPNAYANNHHYTTDAGERDSLISLGWQDEGIAWYGAQVG